MSDTFTALVLEVHGDDVRPVLRQLTADVLPAGDVEIEVAYSAINYKDALAVTNSAPIIRTDFPVAPGVDLAGTVLRSDAAEFGAGDRVLATGYGLGEERWGGYSRRARLEAGWLVPVPDALSLHDAMVIGTAGFTAVLAVMALEDNGLAPQQGPIVVTGASGGVGGFAVALLGAAGYDVVASTGRTEEAEYLRALGANEIQPRDALSTPARGALGGERWAGAVDVVGGTTLANLVRTTKRHGAVAVCGLAGSPALETTVYPFILRGVSLLGIDSNYCPQPRRRRGWARLAEVLTADVLKRMTHATIPLSEVPALSEDVLAGRVRGRTVVEVASPDRAA